MSIHFLKDSVTTLNNHTQPAYGLASLLLEEMARLEAGEPTRLKPVELVAMTQSLQQHCRVVDRTACSIQERMEEDRL